MNRRKAKKEEIEVPAPVIPKELRITRAQKRVKYEEARAYWDEKTEHYGYEDPPPENVVARMNSILVAPDRIAAETLLRKTLACMEIMILGAWARGKIEGPSNPISLARRLKRIESLVKMLKAKGLHDQAKTQERRYAETAARLKALDNPIQIK